MFKNKKILIVLSVALMLCVISSVGVYLLLSPHRATVFVFKDNCAAGTQITQEILTPVQVDATIVQAGKSASINEQYVTADEYAEVLKNAGTLRWDVTKGSTLTKSMLTTYSGSKVERLMKPSAIAITLSADYISAVTNELSSGARVNVYASYDADGGETKLLLQNIRVLTAPKSSEGLLVGVTLEVDHEQSLKLVHAITYAKVYLGLVDEMGYQYTEEEEPAYDLTGFLVEAQPEDRPDEEKTSTLEENSTPNSQEGPTASKTENSTASSVPAPSPTE